MTSRANGDHSALLQTGVPENVKKFKKFEKMYMLQNICVMVTTDQVAFVCVFFSFLQCFMRRNNSLRLFDIKKNEEGQEQALSDKKTGRQVHCQLPKLHLKGSSTKKFSIAQISYFG